ncbi:MAG: hypothetical protein HUJ25_01440 [Crocinitomicaceae bacterium]|nr:hypothetical protein [Crocinitomicaceae bacterium]
MKTIRQAMEALREEDHRRALYSALVFIMLLILFFLLVGFEQPDPPLKEKEVLMTLEDIEYDFGSQPEGGSQSNDMNPDVVPVPENIEEPSVEHETQEESPVEVSSSNGDNNNTNTTQEVSPPVDNTFTFGNGNGNGTGTGQGNEFGSGTGVGGNGQGNTPGDGTYNPERKRLVDPSYSSNAQEEGKIALDIYVDASGKIVKTKYKQSKSTSGSEYLKKLAVNAAYTMKYDAKAGAGIEYVGYVVFRFIKS